MRRVTPAPAWLHDLGAAVAAAANAPLVLLRSLVFACACLLGFQGIASARGPVGFERMEAAWQRLHDYSMTIEAYEVLGHEKSEHELRYAFRKPDRARLDVIAGTKSGSTIVWNGGDQVTAYRRGLSFLKMHGGVRDKDLTSLRGNGILGPNLGDIVACFSTHRDAMHERPGPVLDGEETDEIALDYAGIVCPDDPPGDRAVTLDVLDVSQRTGLVLLRERYQGDEVVERWTLKNYRLDAGLDDRALE